MRYLKIYVIVFNCIILFQGNMFGNTADEKTQTFIVTGKDVPVLYKATGTVESRTSTEISPRITSRITDILVRSGDHVKRDQKIIQLEDNALRTSVMEAQNRIDSISAGINSAKQAVKSSEAQWELNKAEKERDEKLYTKKAISKKQYEQTTSDYKKAEAELNKSQQNVESLIADKKAAEQTLERSKTLLAYSSIDSPIDGVVGERSVDPGDLAIPGKILMKIFDPSKLMLEIPVRESLIKKIKIGDRITFNVEALNKVFYGEIKEIVPYVDTRTRTFLVKVCIDESQGLIPGMYGVAEIQIGTEKELLVPENAVTRIGQTETVLLLEKDNSVKKIFVRTVKSSIPNMLVVLSGLQEGDKIVLKIMK